MNSCHELLTYKEINMEVVEDLENIKYLVISSRHLMKMRGLVGVKLRELWEFRKGHCVEGAMNLVCL